LIVTFLIFCVLVFSDKLFNYGMTKAGFTFSDYIAIHVHMEDTNELDRHSTETETRTKTTRQNVRVMKFIF
jgi:hypothetical protein